MEQHLWGSQLGNKTAETMSITFDVFEQPYWLPGEHIRGSVVIRVPYSAAISSARIDLEGLSLIHSVNKDRSREFSVHKFLYQNHDVRCVAKVSGEVQKSSYLATYRIPFDFLISRTISSNADKLPAGCLELPPTTLIGGLAWSPRHGRVFAQPNISYHLVGEVVLLDQSSPSTWTLREEKPIKIWKSSSIMPPISLGDFAAEYRTVAETPCALRRLESPKLRLRISTTEPAAVAFNCRQSDQVANVDLRVCFSRPATSHAVDERRLRSLLAKVKIQVQTCLRAKTFYTPVAFEKVPGQAMLTPTSNCRMNDQAFQLGASMGLPVESAAPSLGGSLKEAYDGPFAVAGKGDDDEEEEMKWETHKRRRSDDGAQASTADYSLWHSSNLFRCPLTIPHGLVPTFWCPTASQQYSLLLDVKVSGLNTEQTKLRLEVPLQIFYDLGPSATPGGPVCRRLRSVATERRTGYDQDEENDEDVCTTIVMHDIEEGAPPMYV
ncbi:hypothetical protein AYL99_03328 [Fonsecaea erecta]|uniref:Arrestin-like N-terminal domain-containing protein n=1 Tax=Fonsecaea erecta TaxID=1367422 RepID=A0A178ZMV7_9EURO|nr:hypothetical protein AYL99_03328 [Fonsecaea erecta]OAP61127.1 hypothetical protein AYL99_03328 [Fonsecaea erecta]